MQSDVSGLKFLTCSAVAVCRLSGLTFARPGVCAVCRFCVLALVQFVRTVRFVFVDVIPEWQGTRPVLLGIGVLNWIV